MFYSWTPAKEMSKSKTAQRLPDTGGGLARQPLQKGRKYSYGTKRMTVDEGWLLGGRSGNPPSTARL